MTDFLRYLREKVVNMLFLSVLKNLIDDCNVINLNLVCTKYILGEISKWENGFRLDRWLCGVTSSSCSKNQSIPLSINSSFLWLSLLPFDLPNRCGTLLLVCCFLVSPWDPLPRTVKLPSRLVRDSIRSD